MAEIINLRQARKRKVREDKAAAAAQNRTAFGRTKQERTLEEARRDLEQRRIEGHKRDPEAE
jgi:Domain of unknown function (DUF4169)